MGYMAASASLAANTVSANVFSGKPHEFAVRPSIARIAVTGSAAGLNAYISAGDQMIVDGERVGAQNRDPIDPDDYAFNVPLAPGERLIAKFHNTTAGALTYWIVAKVEPVA